MKLKSIGEKFISAITASAIIFTGFCIAPAEITVAAETVVIDTTTEYQTIRGFGGINHPEWTGQDMTDSQRQTAFGNGTDELGLTILRIFVNPDKNQWNKAVPTAKYAYENGVTVFASPWEPPSNLAESGGSNGKLHIPKSNYEAYAQHLNDFGTYMKNNGVDLYSISVQNEPDYASEWTYWSTDETVDFIADYGDKITSTRLMSPESFQYAPLNASWVKDGGKKFYQKIMANSKAFANCDVFGTHMYGTTRDWMDYPELENCGKEIWMTEVYVPNSDADSANRWPEALQVSENIHNALVIGNMSVYTWWYIRRSYGLMDENGAITKRGYNMAQYSKFVRPGDIRIEATEQPAKDVFVSAYKNDDNQVTIVAVNKSTEGYAQLFSIGSGENIVNVDRYRTSVNENIALTKNLEYTGGSFYAQLPAESVSTFVVSLEGNGVTPGTEPDENGYFFHDTFEGDVFDWESRGSASVILSGRTAYEGSESLLVQERTAAWNGGMKKLNPKVFVPGNEFSFSADVMYFDGDAVNNFFMKLEYTGSDGETHYSSIAQAKAVKGEWVQLANTNYTIPTDASDMKLYIETENDTNNFYIDEAIGALPGTVIKGAGEITFILGDVNCDGTIDSFDLVATRKGILGNFKSNVAALAADVNQDGKTTVADLVMLKEYILGVINKFEKAPANKMTMKEYTEKVAPLLKETEPDEERNEKPGVQYGTVSKQSYWSTTCNRQKNFNILLPANYSENKKYPVLYAMHGYWQNEDTLIDESDESMRTRQIIGNAIASGEAEEMIVVFPDIYSSATQPACTAMDDANNAAYDNFINDLTKDLMPYIESHYPVKTGRDNTAITGFSMGGREALIIGMKRPDLFGYVGAICPAPGVHDVVSIADFKYNDVEPYLLLLTAGSNDTVVYSTPSGYNDDLTNNGVPHIWQYVTGGYHGGNSIRAHIYNYVRWIFKN
ncbi:MAG: alpha/beta hydrolase-fold protein [Ruminococcus flavefaciens]|nr:alpha/beta hydrolase-fold protein [Ruminococcus flavefaciens]MCM1362225.1 alpha/beta hydrolase-fold protein [Clostridiales bacterium]